MVTDVNLPGLTLLKRSGGMMWQELGINVLKQQCASGRCGRFRYCQQECVVTLSDAGTFHARAELRTRTGRRRVMTMPEGEKGRRAPFKQSRRDARWQRVKIWMILLKW